MLDVAGNFINDLDCVKRVNINHADGNECKTKLSKDLTLGLWNEKIVEPLINEYFDMKVNNTKLTKGKYCAYDYECETKKTRYELKSRRIKHDKYDSVFISTRKIEKGWVDGYRLVLLFYFTDGLYYTEYDPYVFKTYKKTLLSVYRDGRREDDNVYNIPIMALKKVEL